MEEHRRKPWLLDNDAPPVRIAILLVLAAVLVYVPAMRGGFIWDDEALVMANPLVTRPGGLLALWLGAPAPDFAPVTYSTFWLEWRLWGAHPVGYHLVNIALHAGSVLLLWRVLLALRAPGAALGALLFAVHPVNVASVAWIAERKNTLSLFFYLAAILWYVDGRSSRYRLAGVAAMCAFLGKGSTVVLPVVLLGCQWARRGRLDRVEFRRVLPIAAAAGAVALLTAGYQARLVHGASAAVSPAFRVIRAGEAFWFYLGKALWPARLCPLYPMWGIDPHAPLQYAPALLAAGLLVALWLARARIGRGPFYAFGYYAIALLPVLGFVNMTFMDQTYAADWWQHLALPAMAALTGGLVGASPWRGLRWCALILAGVLGMATWDEAGAYRSLESHSRHILALNPGSWTALDNLGTALLREGNLRDSIPLFEAAARVRPEDRDVRLNLASVLHAAHRDREALEEYARVAPRNAPACDAMGAILYAQGRYAEAAAQFEEAVRLSPGDIHARSNLERARRAAAP